MKPKKVPGKLVKWYRKVAKKGEVTAQKSLAFLLGLQNKMEKSTYWMRKAAEQGDRWAQSHLILRESDRVQACIWRTLAVEQGARNTAIYGGQVGCGMEAKKLAQEWKEKGK